MFKECFDVCSALAQAPKPTLRTPSGVVMLKMYSTSCQVGLERCLEQEAEMQHKHVLQTQMCEKLFVRSACWHAEVMLQQQP